MVIKPSESYHDSHIMGQGYIDGQTAKRWYICIRIDYMGIDESKQFALGVDVNLSHDFRLNRDLCLVVHSAVEEFSTPFSMLPPAGVRRVSMLYRPQGPLTDSTSDTARYRVYLSVKNRYYAQLVYQLGHELCHIFADPRRTNWFVESCCEMAALTLLRRMSKLWSNNSLYIRWRKYAPKFRHYAQNGIQEAKEAEEPSDRQKNTIVAEMLCPLFEESAESWDALCLLGQGFASPPVDLTDWNPGSVNFSFDRWLQAAPEYLKDIIIRIGKTLKDCWPDFDFCHSVMPF
jgi:hypothetical protein